MSNDLTELWQLKKVVVDLTIELGNAKSKLVSADVAAAHKDEMINNLERRLEFFQQRITRLEAVNKSAHTKLTNVRKSYARRPAQLPEANVRDPVRYLLLCARSICWRPKP